MRRREDDSKSKDREALAKSICEFLVKLRMSDPVDDRLRRKIFRLVHRGLRYAREDLEWCRFMLYALGTLMTDGWIN